MNYTATEENMEHCCNQKFIKQEDSIRKGGLRTMPFIIVNESFEQLVSIGIQPNMILYFTKVYHMEGAKGASLLSLWSFLSAFLSIPGAFISDSYLGRFRVIALGSIISFGGMTLLWLTAVIPQAKPAPCNLPHTHCDNPTFAQLILLGSSLVLISIGAGCIRPCAVAFGVDQLVKTDNPEKNERVLQKYFNWYYASIGLSSIIGLTLVVYIQDHFGLKMGFGIPVVLLLSSAFFFLVGCPLYVKVKIHKSLFTELTQVIVAAFRNRNLAFPADKLNRVYYHIDNSNFVKPSDKLRFLNKACIIRNPEEDFDSDGSAVKPWELCSVDQVEGLKALIRVIPIWSTGIMIFTTLCQSSITVLQANSMDRYITSNFQIPAGSFGLFTAIAATLGTAIYGQVVIPLVAKYSQQPHGARPTLRMGIGLLISCLAMALGAIVESIRRKSAFEEVLRDEPKSVGNMSAMWLIPQFSLTGLAEGIHSVAQLEFYFSQLPKTMSTLGMALFTLGTAFAGLLGSLIFTIVNNVTKSGGISWLSTDLNKGQYDYYYGLLTFLSLLNFVYFLVCCRAYGPCEETRARVPNEREDLKEGLLSKTNEQFPSSSLT